MGCKLPLLGLTLRDQVEKPVVFQAESARESNRNCEMVDFEMGLGEGRERKRE